MSYKSYRSYPSYKSHKKFVNSFNFPNPDWGKLPHDFPNLSKKGLTREEGHLLDAIVLAWLTTTPEGKNYLARKLRIGLFGLFGLIGLISLITLKGNFSKQAKAAGVILDEAIQSTMSAILKK